MVDPILRMGDRQARDWKQKQEELGLSVTFRGKEFNASRSWCYDWLAKHGYVSRLKTNRRTVSPESMAVALAKFIHMQEERIYKGHMIPGNRRVNIDQVPCNLDNQGCSN